MSKIGSFVLTLSIFSAVSLWGQTNDFSSAKSLYDKGMYSSARAIFETLGNDVDARAYALLCDISLKTKGYEQTMGDFMSEYPYSGYLTQMRWKHGLNLFDKGDYARAAQELDAAGPEAVSKNGKAEYYYKTSYSHFATGDYAPALKGFALVDQMKQNNYSAPARYGLGYIHYASENFKEACVWFEKAVKDPRFEALSSYYLMECHFMLKDYDYVTSKGGEMFKAVPQDRKEHLARILSEAYLVKGDADSAKKYYDEIKVPEGENREDYFYAGSLMYALGDYQGAADKYSLMTDRTDSLGQIANYQMAFSYIQLKNKVAAAQSFKDASGFSYNEEIAEDAFFNYAKLSFDLNNDPAPFEAYLAKYTDKKRGSKIYSYQALAALYNHDYATAVAAYDKIDELDAEMQANYMKANYLRANQLIRGGSYRSAVPCLKAAAYYSDKRSGINQLSRYWLAEAYYRDGQYGEARRVLSELYNISALDGKPEGERLPYNIAYSYFKEGDYDNAAKWFGRFEGSDALKNDALIRVGDCSFIKADYKAAIDSYEKALSLYGFETDLYPLYQEGLAYGLSGENAKKIEVLERGRGASPKAGFYSESLYELGRAYVDAKQDDKALDCYNQLLEAHSGNVVTARALLGLGMIYRNKLDYDKSLSYYKQVVSSMPGTDFSADALAAIESVYQAKQEPETYIAYVESLGSEHDVDSEDHESMLFNGASQVYLAGNYSKALVSLEAYMEKYPEGAHKDDALFFMAECYRYTDAKDKACDLYKQAMESGTSFRESAAASYSALCYELERYEDAFSGYERLMSIAKIDANKHTATVGMMNSAYKAKGYVNAISWSDKTLADKATTAAEKLQAQYVKAKSLLARSERDKAFAILKTLAAKPVTPQGAEAAYLVIQESYDKGDFAEVEKKVFAFSDAKSGESYWLAKAFITLGDSYAEREDYKQAKATFESVRDGYTPKDGTDDVQDNVTLRLSKLATLQ